jgi:hypothetical protein
MAEAKQAEIQRNRIDLLNAINPYVGTYFSREFVFNDVLQLTQEEIDKMQKEIQNDTQLQTLLQQQQPWQLQQMEMQKNAGPGSQQAAAFSKNVTGDAAGQTVDPAAYNPSNPQVENIDRLRIFSKQHGVKS